MLNLLPVAGLLLAGSAMPAVAQTAVAASATDHPEKTASGGTFSAPAGWTVTARSKLVELSAPEGNFRIAVVDVGAAADAKSAAAAAWQIWEPRNARPPKLVTALAPREGWAERQVVDYETSPNEKRVIKAIAFRGGSAWTVAIVDGSEATAEKRLAALGLVSQSLRPADYARETFAGRTAHPMDAARIAQLKAFVAQAMTELGVPGASFALTTRARTIYSTGIGVRLLGDLTPVDADSEFLIASNTKGLATLMLAKLVDEGKLRWEEQVTDAYPAFRLGSDATTRKVLIKNLVCACTGLPRKDLQVLFNSNPDAAASDAFIQLAATEPTSGFGEVFQYNNLMAAAAGYIGGHLVHPEMKLDDAFYRSINEKVLAPLGMTATTFDFKRAMLADWARPHAAAIDGKPAPILGAGMKLNYAFTRYAGAGGAWSTANDLIKYVRFELNEGKLDDGTQYVSAKNLLQRRVPNVPIGEDATYGMGLMVDRAYGIEVVHHGGSLGGYKSDVLVIPAADLGAVILTNADNGQMLLRPFMRRLLELVYDGKDEAAADVAAAAAQSHAELATERARVSIKPDPVAVGVLAHDYTNPDLGTIKVVPTNTGVDFALRNFTTPVGTRKNDDGTLSFVMLDPTFLFEPLVVGTDAGKPILIARDGQHEFKFVASR